METAVRTILSRQHGLITTRQALANGLTEDQLRHRVKTGDLIRVHRSVYRVPTSPRTPEQTALAACLACGKDAVVSGLTAARLLGLVDGAEVRPQVTIPANMRRRVTGVDVRRCDLQQGERATRAGVPVTAVRRTLLDVAGQLPRVILDEAADRAFRAGLDPRSLLEYLKRPQSRRSCGSGTLREIARDRAEHGVPETFLENKAIGVLRRFGLPDPVRQFKTLVRGPRVRFDLAYPDERVGIELDGKGHLTLDQWQADHDRDNASELARWRVLRFTDLDLSERPLYVAMTVGDALGLRPSRWVSDVRPRSVV